MPNPPRPRPRPRQNTPPEDAIGIDKPYKLVPFPRKAPDKKHPAQNGDDHYGHDRYNTKRLHGSLTLEMTVGTVLHVSTGVSVLGSDVNHKRIPLIKTMVQTPAQTPAQTTVQTTVGQSSDSAPAKRQTRPQDKQLIIPGSSLKGVIRTVYEAITNSTLAVVSSRYRNKMPKNRLPCRKKEELCPASRVFGAMDWQGLVQFSDAVCLGSSPGVGFMPSLYRPRPDENPAYFQQGIARGRKFYHHATHAADRGEQQGIPVLQAGLQSTFTTTLHFKNLSEAELGTLLICLGQDPEHPLALKVGAGKPIGMGSMTVRVTAVEQPQNLAERYRSYAVQPTILTGQQVRGWIQPLIQTAHRSLIEKPQLQALSEILRYPTDREPPEGMY